MLNCSKETLKLRLSVGLVTKHSTQRAKHGSSVWVVGVRLNASKAGADLIVSIVHVFSPMRTTVTSWPHSKKLECEG